LEKINLNFSGNIKDNKKIIWNDFPLDPAKKNPGYGPDRSSQSKIIY